MKNYFLILFSFFTLFSYSQETSFYMHLNDMDFVPIETKNRSNNDGIEIKTRKAEFDNVLKKHKIKHFKQAFPTAASEWLRSVYYVEGDESLIQEIKGNFKGEISNVERLSKPIKCYTPSDYCFHSFYTETCLQHNLDLIKAKEAWDISKDLPKIPLAIIDDAFDLTHEDLKNQFENVPSDNYPSSDKPHGTMVAGILSAETDNGIGISSVSFNAKIYASTSIGWDNEVLLLAQKGYRVINCSWINSCIYSSIQDSLYREIRDVWNTVVVAGAGNENECGNWVNSDAPSAKVYPASYESVISVTSIGSQEDRRDCHRSIMGNPKSSDNHNDAVDICAPGYSISTTGLNDAYCNSNGSSLASPHVAGAIGLVISVNPCLTAKEAINIVINSADPSLYSIPENSVYSGLLGAGRLDVFQAVKLAGTKSATGLLTGNNIYTCRYAANLNNIEISNNANITIQARNEINITGTFEAQAGSTLYLSTESNSINSCNW